MKATRLLSHAARFLQPEHGLIPTFSVARLIALPRPIGGFPLRKSGILTFGSSDMAR